MEILIYAAMLLVIILVSIVWANAIDYMQNHHPDYKGEDFLQEEEEEKKS